MFRLVGRLYCPLHTNLGPTSMASCPFCPFCWYYLPLTVNFQTHKVLYCVVPPPMVFSPVVILWLGLLSFPIVIFSALTAISVICTTYIVSRAFFWILFLFRMPNLFFRQCNERYFFTVDIFFGDGFLKSTEVSLLPNNYNLN